MDQKQTEENSNTKSDIRQSLRYKTLLNSIKETKRVEQV